MLVAMSQLIRLCRRVFRRQTYFKMFCPIKLTASIIATKANMTPAETWRGLVANSLSGTFRLTLIVLYQVRTL